MHLLQWHIFFLSIPMYSPPWGTSLFCFCLVITGFPSFDYADLPSGLPWHHRDKQLGEKNPDHPEQRKEWGFHPGRMLVKFWQHPTCPNPQHRKNWDVCSPWHSVTFGSWEVLRKYTHPLGMKDLFLLRIITSSLVYANIFRVAVSGKNMERPSAL